MKIVMDGESRTISDELAEKILKMMDEAKPIPVTLDFPVEAEWFWRCTPQQRHDAVESITTCTDTPLSTTLFKWIPQQEFK